MLQELRVIYVLVDTYCVRKGKNKSDFTKDLGADQSRTKLSLTHLRPPQKPLLFIVRLGFKY